MAQQKGRNHETQPNEDHVFFWDYTDDDSRFIDQTHKDLRDMADAFGAEFLIDTDDLIDNPTDGDYGFNYPKLAERLNEAGWDTYDGDAFFAVYPAGTPAVDVEEAGSEAGENAGSNAGSLAESLAENAGSEAGLDDETLAQLYADQAVLLLAIERGYLTNDQAAELQLEI